MMSGIRQLELKDLDISFDLAIEGEPGVFISPQEQKRISDIARLVFENDRKKYSWFDVYEFLIGQGWDWRVSGYIAWASSKTLEREPTTQLLLATTVLSLKSDRVINTWRKKNPAIDQTIAKLQVLELFESKAARIHALAVSASDPDYKHHSDRKTSFVMDGSLVPRAKIEVERTRTDPLDLTDEELQQIIRGDKEDQGEKK